MAFCAQCGSVVEQSASFCSKCGQPSKASLESAVKSNYQADQEVTLFDRHNILVTAYRLVVRGQTFPLSAITSVAGEKTIKSAKGSIIAMGFGLLMILMALLEAAAGMGEYSLGGVVVGLLIFGLGFWAFRLRKPDYSVNISTASGKTINVHTDKNESLVQELIMVLNQALVSRGSRVA